MSDVQPRPADGVGAADSADPDGRASAAYLIDEALAYLYPAALRAAAAVGVADHLADGPRTPAELAGPTDTDPAYLHRVLRLLATRGLFAEDGTGAFRLTAAGSALRTDAPLSVRSAVLMITDRTMWLPAGEMDRCLREGGSAFDAIFGMPFFDHFARDAATAAVFHDGMAAMSDPEDQPIADAYDFPEHGVVVDVGGGHGGLLRPSCAAGPHCTACSTTGSTCWPATAWTPRTSRDVGGLPRATSSPPSPTAPRST